MLSRVRSECEALSRVSRSGREKEGREAEAGWAGSALCDALLYVYPFLLLNFTASSKSEGSPSQRLENAVKKSEDKKEVFRPLKPAVRILQNQFYLFQA